MITNKKLERIGKYLVSHNSTIRKTAAHYNIPKSTVHHALKTRLSKINYGLYEELRAVLEKNIAERHIRGGLATKRKMAKLRKA